MWFVFLRNLREVLKNRADLTCNISLNRVEEIRGLFVEIKVVINGLVLKIMQLDEKHILLRFSLSEPRMTDLPTLRYINVNDTGSGHEKFDHRCVNPRAKVLGGKYNRTILGKREDCGTLYSLLKLCSWYLKYL